MIQDSITPYIYKKPVILKRDDTARSAACAMVDNGVGCVLVAGDGGEVVGIATDRDLACRLMAYGRPNLNASQIRLDDVMTPEPIMVDQMSSVLDVIDVMKEYGVRRVPVFETTFNGTGGAKCLGIVTLDDLVATQVIDKDDLAEVITAQVKIRKRGIPKAMSSLASMVQTRQEFFKSLSSSLQMSGAATRELMHFVLGCVIQRIQPSAAQRLLSTFPKLIRSDFEGLMVGPDKSITANTLIEGVMGRFSRKRQPAEKLIASLWSSLGELVGERVLANARHKLPRDIAELLPSADSVSAKSDLETEERQTERGLQNGTSSRYIADSIHSGYR